jgi:hypothetical protein
VRKLAPIFFIVVATFIAPLQQAFALVAVSGYYGPTWLYSGFTNSSRVTGQGYKFALHLDPIPLVPVSIGVSTGTTDFNKTEFSVLPMTKAQLSLTSLEVSAWLPLMPVLTPYAKIGYVVDGQLKMDYEAPIAGGTDFHPDVLGADFALGVKYKLIPFVSLLVEVARGSHTVKYFSQRKIFTINTAYLGLEASI